jgi:hypothetical protein
MAASLLRRNRPPAPAQPVAEGHAPDLLAQQERLTERFALMQSELGGLFYEMAIRNHVQMEILTRKAAELQRLEGEIGAIERLLDSGAQAIGGHCDGCSAIYAPGAAFCAQCARPVTG